MQIKADRRRRHVQPDPERVRRAGAIAVEYCSSKLRMAKVLAELERGGDHLQRGYASVRDFAVHALRLPGVDVPLLLELGRALPQPAATPEDGTPGNGTHDDAAPDTAMGVEGMSDEGAATDAPVGEDTAAPETDANRDRSPEPPTVEDRVQDGALSMENAAQLSRLWAALGDVDDETRRHWMRAAETTPPYRFRQLVRQAVEDAAQAERTVSLPLQVTESARDEFRRARDLASRRARRALTDGQVFAVIVRAYVASEDQRLVGEKKRRVASTKLLPGKRYVPATVVRRIRERADDRCEVPGCSNGGFLELMHVGRRHADGGGREVGDLALGCSTHHVLLDAGVIRFAGWDPSRRPRFRAKDGRLMVVRPRPTPRIADGVSHATEQERCGKVATPRARQRARAPP